MAKKNNLLPWVSSLGALAFALWLVVGWAHLLLTSPLQVDGSDLCLTLADSRMNSADSFWFVGDDGSSASFVQKKGPFDHQRFQVSWQTLPESERYRLQGGYWLPRWRWIPIENRDLGCEAAQPVAEP